MTHEACRALFIDLAYGELGRSAAARVEDHLAGCPECKAEWARLGATRRTMQALKPAEPDAGGARILLAAARQAAEARAATRQARLFPGWVWKLSATAAAVLIVGGVSYRILWPRPGSFLEPAPDSTARASIAAKPPPAVMAPEQSEVAKPALPAARAPQPAAAPAERHAKATAGPAATEAYAAHHKAKKLVAPAASMPVAEAAQPRPAEAGAPRRDEGKLARAEKSAPGAGAAPVAPAPAAPSPPPPPSSPSPVMDPASERLAVRHSPSVASANERSPAAQAKDARKSDAAEEEPLGGMAGSVSGATSGERTARSRQAQGQTALADRSPSAAPRPASTQEEIDDLVRALDERRRAGQLAAVAIAPCPGQGAVERRFYRDHGRIVIYQNREPTSDGSVTVDRYYDRAGHLRLARITRIQAGRRTVERNYLDATGERTLSGDRIPGPGEPDPEAVLRSSTPCADGP